MWGVYVCVGGGGGGGWNLAKFWINMYRHTKDESNR